MDVRATLKSAVKATLPFSSRRAIRNTTNLALAHMRRLPVPGTGKIYKRFMIVSAARSGSTMLVERCDSHPNAICYGEIFHDNHIGWMSHQGPQGTSLLKRRALDPGDFLETFVWSRKPSNIRSVGFKLLYPHYFQNRDPFDVYLDSAGTTQIIFLRRQNFLKMYLSLLNGRETNRYQIRSERERGPIRRRELSLEGCVNFFKRNLVQEEIVRHRFRNHPHIDVAYEALVASPEVENRRICEFLDIPDAPLSQDVVQMSTASLRQQISNYDAIRDQLRGTRWVRYFDED